MATSDAGLRLALLAAWIPTENGSFSEAASKERLSGIGNIKSSLCLKY